MTEGQPTHRRPRPPTVYDVAEMAGVSHATVSRAVNGLDGMTESTRRRVLEIVAFVGYEPNTSARGLAGRFRPQLAAVLVGVGSPMREAALLDGLARAARRRGYALTSVGVDPRDARSVAAAAERLGEPGIGGAVFVLSDGAGTDAVVGRLSGIRGVRLAASGGQAARALAVDHLTALGHRAIVHVATGAADDGHRLGAAWALPADGTALVAPTASFALGFARGLRERGIRVPEDVSVVALEDHPDAAHFTPPVTAIATDPAELAEAAVDALLRARERSGRAADPQASPRLAVRASTAPPAAAPSAP